MRISDWSSDVCSSDLGKPGFSRRDRLRPCGNDSLRYCRSCKRIDNKELARAGGERWWSTRHRRVEERREREDLRSEEHTSELQSLMRLSYAVFCLKTKKKKQHNHI